jgi:hypothetical protein
MIFLTAARRAPHITALRAERTWIEVQRLPAAQRRRVPEVGQEGPSLGPFNKAGAIWRFAPDDLIRTSVPLSEIPF